MFKGFTFIIIKHVYYKMSAKSNVYQSYVYKNNYNCNSEPDLILIVASRQSSAVQPHLFIYLNHSFDIQARLKIIS